MKTIANQKRALTGWLLALALLLAGCGIMNPDGEIDDNRYSATASFSFDVQVANKSGLNITTINGPIHITGVSGLQTATIEGEREVRSNSTDDAREHLQELVVRVSEGSNNDIVYVETIQPDKTHGRQYQVSYDIRVPAYWDVNVYAVNGVVTVDSIRGNTKSAIVNGNAILNDLSGHVHASITNGQLDARLRFPDKGQVELLTTNGAVNLWIPRITSAMFSAKVTNGVIGVSNLTLADLRSTPTSVQGQLGDGQGLVTLRTTNGNITATGY